ncbi:MAG: hypothetical protein LBQ52_09140 [Helicobacteraceae bacterium]|jgi:hypothetical protein|nr:hypothetical protein [Helicobacteraceae bacterium]
MKTIKTIVSIVIFLFIFVVIGEIAKNDDGRGAMNTMRKTAQESCAERFEAYEQYLDKPDRQGGIDYCDCAISAIWANKNAEEIRRFERLVEEAKDGDDVEKMVAALSSIGERLACVDQVVEKHSDRYGSEPPGFFVAMQIMGCDFAIKDPKMCACSSKGVFQDVTYSDLLQIERDTSAYDLENPKSEFEIKVANAFTEAFKRCSQ